MRVPLQQRASRSNPATASNKRSKNKRGVSSDGVPPVKIKKRKSIESPDDATSLEGSGGGIVVANPPAKRQPNKKTLPGAKKTETTVKQSVAKKQYVRKIAELKGAMGKGKVLKKVVSEVKKTVGVKAKKLQSRKLSGAESLALSGAETDVAKEVSAPDKVVDQQVPVPRKTQKSVKVTERKPKQRKAGTEERLPPARKKPQKAQKKLTAKKVAGVKSAYAVAAMKKSRRKSSVDDSVVGGDAQSGEQPVGVPVSAQLAEVIEGVAKNLMRAKKTKENEDSASAIKNKMVGVGNKNSRKQQAKKTPKSGDEVVKRVDVIDKICDGPVTSITGGKVDKVLDKVVVVEGKVKTPAKKALKEKKIEVKTKKKVIVKKASLKAAVKQAKVTFQVKTEPRKRMTKKEKALKLEKQLATAGSSFHDEYNSSTSDDCTLDMLLRRQKQIKVEAAVKSENPVDQKPVVSSAIKTELATTNVLSKKKIKVKIESKNGEVIKQVPSQPKKKVTKKVLPSSKLKTKALNIKQQTVYKTLKAGNRKTVVTKVKRVRPNEVSRLGSGTDVEQRARRMKLFGFWSGPKRHRVASLNALAKVHCLYENESRGAIMSVCTKPSSPEGSTSGEDAPETKAVVPVVQASTRTLRSGPGRRGIGQHWDQHTSSSSSSDDNGNSDSSSSPSKLPLSFKQKQVIKVKPPVKKVTKPRRGEVVMDLKDMVVRKRMASLNASAILSASYSPMEKLKKRSSVKDDDSPPLVIDEDVQPARKKKGKKKIYLSKKIVEGEDSDEEGPNIIELATSNNKKVATVIVNQDTDVTITGVYVNSTTHRSSTTHEGYCSIAGMQYRISSTSHTQTEATAVATETLLHTAPELVTPVPSLHAPEVPQQPIKSYTPLGALSNMQPPGGPLSPLGRRHGCASAFSAPPPVPPPVPVPPPHPPHHHHQPPPDQPAPYMHGYYQPAGPLISAHHHHLPKPSALPPLEASPTSTPPTHAAPASAPPPASTSSGTRGGDESSDNDVVITATSCANQNYAAPAAHHHQPAPPPTYRYQAYPLPAAQHIHHQYPYTQYPQQYYPGAVQGVQYSGVPPPPPPQHHYHNPEICYSAPSYPPAPPYYHPKSYSTPQPVSYPRRYGPPHPSQYYPPDLYPPPSDQQTSRQMVATASTSQGYQPPPGDQYPPPPAPPPPLVDAYPPPPPPGPYYPGYPPAPAPPPCYSHSPPARSLAYIDTAYQGCPCPMQSCPKNVNTGPLTGEGKGPDPSVALFQQVPLPPVALALPLEPPQMTGPPSPARGSAGMHPTPSPLATAQGNDHNGVFAGKREPYAAQTVSENRAVIQDLSSRNVGLLTIHKPSSEPAAALETVYVGTVNVGNNVQTLTYDLHKGGSVTKVDSNVKLEGNVVRGVPKKRKMKSENAAAPKPKKRSVDVARKISAKSKKLVQGEVAMTPNGMEDGKTSTAQKAKCKNQPLSSANSCSLHNSKQNAKKRKASNVEILAENQEPPPVALKIVKLTKAKVAKEPKSRPKMCPSSKQQTKTTSAAVDEELQRNQAFSVTAPTIKCSNDIITLQLIETATKSASKTIPKTVSAPVSRSTQKTIMNTNAPLKNRRKPTKSQLSKAQLVVQPESLPKIVKTAPAVLGRKKLAPKAKPAKMLPVEVPISGAGKVKRRRQTDSDVSSKAMHLLRRHGIQDNIRQVENDFNTTNLKVATVLTTTVAKCKVSVVQKKQSTKSVSATSCELTVYQPPVLKKGQFLKPKWSNGWTWEGEPFQAKVHLNSEETCAERICYPSMRHSEGDIIRPLDCVLLKSGTRKVDLPFVAKVAQLWENPDDGEMMVSLLWYYRPEHTDQGRRPEDMRDEIFASKHKDINSVACIEDKCYVLTFNEYCRYRASSLRHQCDVRSSCTVVPQTADYPRRDRQPPPSTSSDMVFFCRRVYDFRQKRILKNPG